MDIHCRICYLVGHETPRKFRAAPNAKEAGHRPASVWQNLPINSRDPECFNKFGGALGSSPSQGWPESAPAQAGSWASTDAGAATEAPPVTVAGKGFPVRRLYDRPVDPAAYSQADQEIFRDTLSSRPCVAGDAGLGLDLSDTGAAGSATRRESHRALEETRLAASKKKPENLGPISSSSTKADSSSFLMSARPGRRSERPRFSSIATNGIGFPSSPASPCPRPGSVSDCTFVSTRSTSPAWRSSASCATSCGICVDRWCSFGTAAPFTGASSSEISFASISGFMSTGSRPMPRNSIRMNLSGPRPSTLCPMVRHQTSPRLGYSCADLSTAFAGPNGYCGPASTPPICRGHAPRYPLFMR